MTKPNQRAALAISGLLALTPLVARAQGITVQYGRGDRPLQGQRFVTMRALAHRLDEAAQAAALGAGDTPRERNGRMQQRFLWAVNDFARQARSFHERMDRYGQQPWDVSYEVADLNQRAQRVSSQLRAARAFADTYEDWADVINTLSLMNRSLNGQNVSLPPYDGRKYHPFDENSRYSDGRHYEGYATPGDDSVVYTRDGYLIGTSLREFRHLADSLVLEANRLVTVAEQSSNPLDRGSRAMEEIRRFAQNAADLYRNSSGDAINVRDTEIALAQLTNDARQNDRTMRQSNAFPRVDWSVSIRLLDQMSSAIPRS